MTEAFTHRHNAEHGHCDKHVVKPGEDVLLDGDNGGEEVSEKDGGEGGDKTHFELKFSLLNLRRRKINPPSTRERTTRQPDTTSQASISAEKAGWINDIAKCLIVI